MTLLRYAHALGKRLGWTLEDEPVDGEHTRTTPGSGAGPVPGRPAGEEGTDRHPPIPSMGAPLDVGPLVAEIASLSVNRQEDARLRWQENGTVRVLVGEILPEGSAGKQTLAARRKRFREALIDRLKAEGWPLVSAPYTFGRGE